MREGLRKVFIRYKLCNILIGISSCRFIIKIGWSGVARTARRKSRKAILAPPAATERQTGHALPATCATPKGTT